MRGGDREETDRQIDGQLDHQRDRDIKEKKGRTEGEGYCATINNERN